MNNTPEQFVKAYSEHLGHTIMYRDINQGTGVYMGKLFKCQWNQDKNVTELWIEHSPPIIVSFDKFRGCATCEGKVSKR